MEDELYEYLVRRSSEREFSVGTNAMYSFVRTKNIDPIKTYYIRSNLK